MRINRLDRLKSLRKYMRTSTTFCDAFGHIRWSMAMYGGIATVAKMGGLKRFLAEDLLNATYLHDSGRSQWLDNLHVKKSGGEPMSSQHMNAYHQILPLGITPFFCPLTLITATGRRYYSQTVNDSALLMRDASRRPLAVRTSIGSRSPL